MRNIGALLVQVVVALAMSEEHFTAYNIQPRQGQDAPPPRFNDGPNGQDFSYSSAGLAKFFKRTDHNDDGKISFNEFLHNDRDYVAKQEREFSKFDANRDGFVTEEEHSGFYKQQSQGILDKQRQQNEYYRNLAAGIEKLAYSPPSGHGGESQNPQQQPYNQESDGQGFGQGAAPYVPAAGAFNHHPPPSFGGNYLPPPPHEHGSYPGPPPSQGNYPPPQGPHSQGHGQGAGSSSAHGGPVSHGNSGPRSHHNHHPNSGEQPNHKGAGGSNDKNDDSEKPGEREDIVLENNKK